MLKQNLLTWFISGLFMSGVPAGVFAQSTPQMLAQQLVEAINSNDRSSIQNLLYPATVEFYKSDSPATLNRQVENFLKYKFSGEIEVTTTKLEDVEQYDLSKDAYIFGGIPLKFSKRPDLKIDINRTETIENDRGQTITIKSKGISEMIIKEDNRWYIIRPEVVPGKMKVKQKQ